MNRKINGKIYIYPWLTRSMWGKQYRAAERGIKFFSPLIAITKTPESDIAFVAAKWSIGLFAYWRVENGGNMFRWTITR